MMEWMASSRGVDRDMMVRGDTVGVILGEGRWGGGSIIRGSEC